MDTKLELKNIRGCLLNSPHQLRVIDFMRKAGQEVPVDPGIPDMDVRMLRAKLILEEAMETITALGIDLNVRYTGVGAGGMIPITKSSVRMEHNMKRGPNFVEILDGCADISVVTYGTLVACGVADIPLIEAIDASNLDKFRGDAHRTSEGKWQKPSDWQPPNIMKVLEDQKESFDAT